jgi:hypothetical protein
MTTSRTRRFSPGSLLIAAALAVGFASASWALSPSARDLPPPPPDAEGLQRAPSSKVDEFYLRPGATFTAYRRVRLGPVEVSFNKLWARQHRNIDAEESSKLRAELATLARTEFARQMQRRDGYELVDAAGPDVLEIRASIVNLDIYAPEVNDASIRRSYVLKAGEATLVAELRDSQTGSLLARVVDRREMREYPDFQLATSVSNSAEARELVGLWSQMLRRYLDTARMDGRTDGKGP